MEDWKWRLQDVLEKYSYNGIKNIEEYSEICEVVEQELSKAREEGYQQGWKDGSKGKVFERIEIETEVKFKDLKGVIDGKEDVWEFLSKLKNNK